MVQAVSGSSFSVDRGETLGLVGESGDADPDRTVAGKPRPDAERVVVVRGVGVVAEAVVLLLRVVEQEAELHALARELAVGEAAHAGEDGGDSFAGIAAHETLASLAAGCPLRRDPFELIDQQIGGGLQVGGTAVAVAP